MKVIGSDECNKGLKKKKDPPKFSRTEVRQAERNVCLVGLELENFDPTVRLMPRAKQENPRRNVQFYRRVKRRVISRHRVQLVGLEDFFSGGSRRVGEKTQGRKKKSSRKWSEG